MRSSTIRAVGYISADLVLRVEFVDGATYDYFDVPQRLFGALLSAGSRGTFHHRRIRGVFRYHRVR